MKRKKKIGEFDWYRCNTNKDGNITGNRHGGSHMSCLAAYKRQTSF